MVQIVLELLKVFYLILPAYFANMAPVFFTKLNFLNSPVDFGAKINGKRLFGKNKTWRGLVTGVVVAIIIAFLQKLLDISSLNILNYQNFILIGFLLGFGALFGDLVESFFKRQLDIRPGKFFFPFDYIDHTIGAFLLLSIAFFIPFWSAVLVVVLTMPLQLLVNLIGYKLKLRKDLL